MAKKEDMMKKFFSSSAYDWYAELLAAIVVVTRPHNVLSIRELIYAYVRGAASCVGSGMEIAKEAQRFPRTTMFSAEMHGDVAWDFVRPRLCRAFDEKGEPILINIHERDLYWGIPAGATATAAPAALTTGLGPMSAARHTTGHPVGGQQSRGQQGPQPVGIRRTPSDKARDSLQPFLQSGRITQADVDDIMARCWRCYHKHAYRQRCQHPQDPDVTCQRIEPWQNAALMAEGKKPRPP
jgi:hypothetical protein